GDHLRKRGNAFGGDTVITGKYRNPNPIDRGHIAMLQRAQFDGDLLDTAERSCRLGQWILMFTRAFKMRSADRFCWLFKPEAHRISSCKSSFKIIGRPAVPNSTRSQSCANS